jgi:hypothetical protein
MNEIRRAGLSQLAISIDFARTQLETALAAERADVQDLPDNIEASAFAAQVLKRPMFELAAAKVHLVEALEHIRTALTKA